MIIDLCDTSKETFQKIIVQNITNPTKRKLDIDYGIVLKESNLTQYGESILEDVKFNPKNDQIISLIYPQKHNNVTEIIAVNLEKDGLYQKVKEKMELERGQDYQFGFPANENMQFIKIKDDIISINEQPYQIEEGLCVVLVKKLQKMQEKQQILNNPTNCTSRKHAHIRVEKGKIYIYDGFENHVSENGVWVLIKHQQMTLNNSYCFKDFRLLISLQY